MGTAGRDEYRLYRPPILNAIRTEEPTPAQPVSTPDHHRDRAVGPTPPVESEEVDRALAVIGEGRHRQPVSRLPIVQRNVLLRRAAGKPIRQPVRESRVSADDRRLRSG